MAQLNQQVLDALERIRLNVSRPATHTYEHRGEHLALNTALQHLRPIIESAADQTGLPVQALLSALYAEDVENQTLRED